MEQQQRRRLRPASSHKQRLLHRRLRSHSAPPSTSSRHVHVPSSPSTRNRHLLLSLLRTDKYAANAGDSTRTRIRTRGGVRRRRKLGIVGQLDDGGGRGEDGGGGRGGDVARDLHDFFNLIILVPIIVLNVLNWNWESLLLASSPTHKRIIKHNSPVLPHSKRRIIKRIKSHITSSSSSPPPTLFPRTAYSGSYFHVYFYTTTLYLLLDSIWITLYPTCVKSPFLVRAHHFASLSYAIVPWHYPGVRWAMGVVGAGEINTWFLIARRVFNRQRFPPWILSLPCCGGDEWGWGWWKVRIKLVSVGFYTSWVVVRLGVYPSVMWEYWGMYKEKEVMWGGWNVMGGCMVLHGVECGLNLKWTWDLVVSKVREFRVVGDG